MAQPFHEQKANLRPYMKFCSPAQLDKLNNAALHILERTGLVIHCKEALDLLGEIGCWLDKDHRVRIPGHIVNQALERAAKRISIYDRRGDPAMLLEGMNSYYGPGPTIQYVYDAFSRERRSSDKEDIQRAAIVCCGLDDIAIRLRRTVDKTAVAAEQQLPVGLTAADRGCVARRDGERRPVGLGSGTG